MTDRTGRPAHHCYADYYVGTAAELYPGDGFRLTTERRPIPVELVRPLVAVSIDDAFGLVAVDLIDRSSMVHEALGNLPPGVAEVVTTVVLDADEPVLIRF